MAEYLGSDWPGCSQVFRLTRERKINGKVQIEVVYGITSLPAERAGAKELLELTRGHWGIENSLHYVRDVTLGEDASRIRMGSAPQIMAAIRNLAIYLFKKLAHKGAASANRYYASNPQAAIDVIARPI
jgi:predicted transposase YbfD/YdcC